MVNGKGVESSLVIRCVQVVKGGPGRVGGQSEINDGEIFSSKPVPRRFHFGPISRIRPSSRPAIESMGRPFHDISSGTIVIWTAPRK